MALMNQTPDVPDLWFSSSEGVIETGRVSGYWLVSRPVHSFTDTLPADAVKLGDVESLALELHELRMAIAKVLDTKQPYVGWHSEEIGNILDRTRGGA